MNEMHKIIDCIMSISGRYHPTNVFQDWVEMSAMSISNAVIYDETREKQFINIKNKYTNDEVIKFSEMLGMLTVLFEQNIDDYLGKIYMQLEASSKQTGQFFTPFHICEMMARFCKEKMYLEEPSCGSSGNILAYAKVLKDKGINYQNELLVTAQDLDYKCVYMSYVQLSLTGVDAVVRQCDALTGKVNIKLYTPVHVMNIKEIKE